jgi:hypothetical protein
MEEASLREQRNISGQKYVDEDWQENFDERADAVEYFQQLNHYAELLNVSDEQKERFIDTKAYSEVSPEDIDGWIKHFGSMSEAVSYAENKLRNHDFEKGEYGDWDLKVETALEWAIDGKHSQRNSKRYPEIVAEEIEEGYNEFEIYDGERGKEAEILWDGPLKDMEE